MAKQYVLDGDMVVCTSGARQTTINVSSQYMVKRGSGKLVATEDDRFTGCFLCQKITAVESSYGMISGAIIGAIAGAQLTPATTALGFTAGAVYGLFSGANEGTKIGSAAGEKAGGAIGETIGAMTMPFPLSPLGALAGKKLGQALGSVAGGVIGAVCNGLVKGIEYGVKGAFISSIAAPIAGALIGGITNGLDRGSVTSMIMKVINPCSLLTKGIPWTSLHDDVTIAGKRALMPDAKITCPMAGLISITKPDWDMMLICAKMSYWVYCTPDEYKEYEKYDPENMGWREVTPEELMEKGMLRKTDKGVYVLEGNSDIKYHPENYNNRTRYFFTDKDYNGYENDDTAENGSGTKMGMYEKDGHYILVARGTARKPDWVDDNLKQGVGLGSDQYEQVISVSKKASQRVGKQKVTITGHSMGGGTSSASGIITGSDTYAFNPAGVHPNTVGKYRKTRANSSNVYSIYAASDPLNGLQNNLPTLAPSSVGMRMELDTENNFDILDPLAYPLDGHGMPLLIEEIERQAALHKDDNKLLASHK